MDRVLEVYVQVPVSVGEVEALGAVGGDEEPPEDRDGIGGYSEQFPASKKSSSG